MLEEPSAVMRGPDPVNERTLVAVTNITVLTPRQAPRFPADGYTITAEAAGTEPPE
jgi:hypothetical protein